VQEAQETATEPKAQGQRRFGLEGEGGVVELQFFQRRTQVFKVFCVDGVDAGEDHGLDFLKPFDGFAARTLYVGDGVTHLDFLGGFDAGNDVTHVTATQLGAGRHVKLEHTDFVGVVFFFSREKLDKIVGTDGAVDNLEIGDNAPEGIEYRVKDQGLQRGLRIAGRSGDAFDDGIQDVLDAFARLAAGSDDLFPFHPQ